MGIIKAFKLGFDYLKYDEDGNVEATQRAVNDVNLDIEAGDFVAVLGEISPKTLCFSTKNIVPKNIA